MSGSRQVRVRSRSLRLSGSDADSRLARTRNALSQSSTLAMRATLPQAVPSTCAQEGERVRVMSTSEGAGIGSAENATAGADGPAGQPTTADPSAEPRVETAEGAEVPAGSA